MHTVDIGQVNYYAALSCGHVLLIVWIFLESVQIITSNAKQVLILCTLPFSESLSRSLIYTGENTVLA